MEFRDVIEIHLPCKKYSDHQAEAEKLTAILYAGRLVLTGGKL